MAKYQLAKILSYSSSGTVKTRKRIQKIIYLLQSAGLNLASDFKLHHFGPYSRSIASAMDDLSSVGVLEEEECRNGNVVQYNYTLTDAGKDAIADLERNPTRSIKTQLKEIERFQHQIDSLLDVDDLWLLELGSTIAFYKNKGLDWDKAIEQACEFKKVSPRDPRSQQAIEFVKRVIS
jgi:uncharacterized protein YwgA